MSQAFSTPVYQKFATTMTAQSDERTAATRTSFFFLCLFTVAIYARPEDIVPAVGKIHLTLILGACATLAYLSAWISGKARVLTSPELRFIVLLTLWFLVGTPFAYWRGGSIDVLTQTWFKTILVFFLLTQTLLSLQRIRYVLWAIIFSELAVASYSVLDPSRSAWVGDRMAGINQGILGWNFLGTAAAVTIPFIAALFICHASFIKSALLAATTGAMMWLLVLTASRSGMLTVAFSVVFTCLFVLRGSARGKLIGIGIILIIALAIGAAPGVFWQRIQTIWSNSAPTTRDALSADYSEQDRRDLLIRAIHFTAEHPLFGVGLGNFGPVSAAELGNTDDAWSGTHNTFAQLSAEAGIPALLLFVVLLALPIRRMWRIARREGRKDEHTELDRMARATLVSMLAVIFGACFAHIAYEYFIYYPIAIAVGIDQIAAVAANAAPVRKEVTPVFDCRDLVYIEKDI